MVELCLLIFGRNAAQCREEAGRSGELLLEEERPAGSKQESAQVPAGEEVLAENGKRPPLILLEKRADLLNIGLHEVAERRLLEGDKRSPTCLERRSELVILRRQWP